MTTSIHARTTTLVSSSIISLLLLAAVFNARAADGTWTNVLGGAWSDTNNWLNGVVANGPGSTANFSTIDVPSNTTITVTADFDPVAIAPFTVGNILFGDIVTAASVGNWVIADGGSGLTLDSAATSNSVIQVTLAQGAANNLFTGWGTATIAAVLNGTNTLVKSGPSHLILQPTTANTYSGGTVISNGMIQLGVGANPPAPDVNPLGLASGPVIFRGGSLRMQNAAIPGQNPSNTPTEQTMPNPIIVEDGQTGTIFFSPRAFPVLGGTVSGGGTLNVFVDFIRDNMGGNWSGFTGRVNVAASTRQNADLRFENTFVAGGGWAGAKVFITTNGINGNTVTMFNNGAAGNIVPIGELSAVSANVVTVTANNTGAGAGNSLPFVLQVGGLNTDASFNGNFAASAVAVTNGVSIIKEGTGTWILNGVTVENNGMTVVSNGVLQIGSGTSGKLGRTAIVSNYATLAFGRSDTLVVTNVIDGPGTLVQRGAGTLILAPSTGANPYSGKTVVTSGLLVPSPEGALGPNPASPVADQLTLNGGGVRSTNNLSIDDSNRGITLGASGGTLSPDSTTTLTVASTIAGAGSLTVIGAGTATLTGPNTYSGRTILNSGTLAIAGESPLGVNPGSFAANQLTLNGGTFRSTTTFAIDDGNRGVSIGGSGGTFAPDASTTLTLATPVAGSGTLTKAGAGTLVIGAVSPFSGAVAINQGTLALGAGGSLANAASITSAGGATFDVSAAGLALGSGQTLSGNITVLGTVTASSGSILSPGTSVGILNITGNLVENGGVTNVIEISSATNDLINVSGDLTLAGVNTIALSPLTALPVATYTLIKYGGALSGSTANLVLQGYPASRVTATLVHNAATKSIDLVLSGSSGELVWSGGLNGNAWDLNATSNWLNGASADAFLSGDNVTFDNLGALNSPVNLVGSLVPGSVTMNSIGNYTFAGSGRISSFASLTKDGGGNLVVLTTNDYTGATTITDGTVQVGDGAASGSLGTGAITNNGTLAYNLPGSQTVGNNISGTGSLNALAGTVALTGNNSYGASSISSGATLQVGNGGGTGSLGTGGVNDEGALVYNRSGTVTNSGSISGSGSLTVRGGGTVVLTAANSFSGATTVSGSTLQVGAAGTSGSLGTAASVTLTNAGTLAFNRSDDLTNSTAIVGPGTLQKTGTGRLVLTNNNSYGATVINAGALQVGDGNSPSGTLGTGNVTITSPGVLVFNRPDVFTNSNVLSGSGSLTHIGPTNLNITVLGDALANGNTYSGGTTISNSTIVLVAATTAPVENGSINANNDGLGTGTLTFQGNSTLQMAAADADDANGATITFDNDIVVPAGQTGTVLSYGRAEYNMDASGAGTLNWRANFVRSDFNGNWSGFTGLINFFPRNGGDEVRISTVPMGFPNAHVVVSNGVIMTHTDGNNQAIDIGALSGDGTFGPGNGASTGPTWRIGARNTESTFDGVIANAGVTSVIKVGTNKLTLTGANTYSGNTTVSNGVLALSTNTLGANGSIDVSAMITLVSPGVLDVTGRTDGTLRLGEVAGQTLGGDGTVQGNLLIGPSGTVAPGFSIGTNTVSGNVTIQGSVVMELNRPGSDLLSASAISIDNITGLPSLTVTNIGSSLQVGDTFNLFDGTISGSFPTVNLPASYAWNTNNLYVNGTISVTAVLLPVITSTTVSDGTNIVLSGTGGNPLGNFNILSSTNVAEPLANWTIIGSGVFGASGEFTSTNAIDPAELLRFYLISF